MWWCNGGSTNTKIRISIKGVISKYILATNEHSLPNDVISKIRTIAIKKKWTKAKSAVLLLVRLQSWIVNLRTYRHISGFTRQVDLLRSALEKPLQTVFINRATIVIQSALRTRVEQKSFHKQLKAINTIQIFILSHYRSHQLLASVESKITNTRSIKTVAALSIYK